MLPGNTLPEENALQELRGNNFSDEEKNNRICHP